MSSPVPGLKLLPPVLRIRLRNWVLDVLRRDGAAPDYDSPVGDLGLFGPHTVTWKVHADFPSMMAGGLNALLLQALHPLALSGVWDHSDFRSDALGRLRSTIAFVARTSYAPRGPAMEAIDRVRGIHRTVQGSAPDGRSYSAEDPHLLNWVHCTEAWSFLRGYQVYCQDRIPVPMQDRYLQETAFIAEALGATNVPKSTHELDLFFKNIQAELVYDQRTREVISVLADLTLPIPMPRLGRGLFLGAGAALLPDWALQLMKRSHGQRFRDHAASGALKLIAPSLREAMAEGGLAWRACKRTGADYADLFRW